jgi:aldose 1-epimerase
MGTIGFAQHGWRLELVPEAGGGIALCRFEGQDIFRPATPEGVASAEAREMGCFPLVPFSNRIAGGVFDFEGRSVTLPRNMGDHPHPLHGQGWRGAWQVEAAETGAAVLLYRHEPDSWPWRYEARQGLSLTPDSLIIQLALTNLSDAPMPAGLGLHPYFPRCEGTRLTAGVTHMWEGTPERIPTHRIDLPPEIGFAGGAVIADLDLDHCFAGWNGKAVIDWPGRPHRLVMEGSPTLTHLVVYTPPGADFFCAEGVENMNDAFNRMGGESETGAWVLAPGESHEVTTTFRVERV